MKLFPCEQSAKLLIRGVPSWPGEPMLFRSRLFAEDGTFVRPVIGRLAGCMSVNFTS